MFDLVLFKLHNYNYKKIDEKALFFVACIMLTCLFFAFSLSFISFLFAFLGQSEDFDRTAFNWLLLLHLGLYFVFQSRKKYIVNNQNELRRKLVKHDTLISILIIVDILFWIASLYFVPMINASFVH